MLKIWLENSQNSLCLRLKKQFLFHSYYFNLSSPESSSSAFNETSSHGIFSKYPVELVANEIYPIGRSSISCFMIGSTYLVSMRASQPTNSLGMHRTRSRVAVWVILVHFLCPTHLYSSNFLWLGPIKNAISTWSLRGGRLRSWDSSQNFANLLYWYSSQSQPSSMGLSFWS